MKIKEECWKLFLRDLLKIFKKDLLEIFEKELLEEDERRGTEERIQEVRLTSSLLLELSYTKRGKLRKNCKRVSGE